MWLCRGNVTLGGLLRSGQLVQMPGSLPVSLGATLCQKGILEGLIFGIRIFQNPHEAPMIEISPCFSPELSGTSTPCCLSVGLGD